MIRFSNDYNHGAHPNILKALVDTNALIRICTSWSTTEEETDALIDAIRALK